ncbi:MAG TPA: TonB-dependent receptor [Candidatus Acidoferrales bacterium]|nr:TonB-dependent receptor [Candidatus Acidoferrales bacterium]
MMRRVLKLSRGIPQLLAVATLIAATPHVAYAQQAQLQGEVLDASGAAVAGASVALRAASYSATVTTGSSGEFSFSGIPAEILGGTITVKAKGFASEEQSWELRRGETTQLQITLKPPPLEQRVIVTAARTQTTAGEFATSVTQLSRAELQSTPAMTLDESLERLPGFSLFRRSSSRTANPTTQGVSLRGLAASGASRALVLEDGIPLNDPFGGWIHWDLVPREAVQGAEVAQEGASSLYGSDAMGGVIQFLTRGAQQAGLALETSYGNENTPNLSLWTGGKRGKWRASLSGEVFRTEGYLLIPEGLRGAVDTRAGSQHAVADLSLGRDFGAPAGIHGSVFARGWYLNELRRNGTPLQTNNTHLGQGALGTSLALGRWGDLELRAYGNAETYRQNFSAVAADRNSETLTDAQTVPVQGVGASAVWSHAAGKRQTFVAGFDASEAIGHSHELNFSGGSPSRMSSAGGRQRNIGFFGEDLAQITPRLFLAASARFDGWRNFAASSISQTIGAGSAANTVFAPRSYTAFDPRLSVTYQLRPNLSWSASLYRSFRAPTLNELYRPFRQGNALTEANSNLIAERLTGGETGLAMTGFSNRIELRGDFFFNEVIDPVANVTLSVTPALITRQRQNLGRTRAPGVEIDASAQLMHGLVVSGGYQFVDAVVTRFPANPALIGNWVPQVPRHAFTFEARYSAPRGVDLSIDGRFVGRQFDDDQNLFPLGRFFVLDAMASKTVGRGVEIFAASENLLDQKYAIAATPVEQLGLPVTIQGGLRLELFQK